MCIIQQVLNSVLLGQRGFVAYRLYIYIFNFIIIYKYIYIHTVYISIHTVYIGHHHAGKALSELGSGLVLISRGM